MGDYIGTTIGVIKGNTRSLDYGSCRRFGVGVQQIILRRFWLPKLPKERI